MSIATPAAEAHTNPASEPPPERRFSNDAIGAIAFSTIIELGYSAFDLNDLTTPIHQIDSILQRGPRRTIGENVFTYLTWDALTQNDAIKLMHYLYIYVTHCVSRDATTGEIRFTKINVTADRPNRRHLLTRLQRVITVTPRSTLPTAP